MLPPLKPGEYDLANIMLLGRDPVTNRSFEECHKEWKTALAEVVERSNTCKWWNFVENLRVRRDCQILQVRLGM